MSLSIDDILETLQSRNLDFGYLKLAEIPHFSLMKDMTKGAKRVSDAIRKKEIIKLCADYDADGVTSCALVVSFFNDIGYPLDWVIPNRFNDGYGVSPKIIERIGHADVLVTVDNGIAALEASKAAKKKEIDLIITDHHTPGPVLPDCYAIVNPKQENCNYPFKDISGCFVAWLFCCAIKHELELDVNMGKYLDLVALSTITDVMPLVGINRHVVRYGLNKINSMKRPFFRELAKSINKQAFTYEDLGFQVGPRLNAAGRMENGSIAVKALMAKDGDAAIHVQLLTEINELRKAMQSDMIEKVMGHARDQEDFVVVYLEDLHEGIVGIVASKAAEETGLPTIILTQAEDGLLKGSGRTVGTVNIFDLVNENRKYLEKFGGHAGACGLSLRAENLEEFSEALRVSSRKLSRDIFEPLDAAIGELAPNDADLDLFYQIEQFAPFGEGNPTPVFRCKEATIISSKAVGKEGDHTRLLLNWNGSEVNVMSFNTDARNYRKGGKVTFNYRLDLNTWNGISSLQFMPTSEVKVKSKH